jgi:hypothetical protein
MISTVIRQRQPADESAYPEICENRSLLLSGW